QPAELRRQARDAAILRQGAAELVRQGTHVGPGERPHHDVARRLRFGTGIEQVETIERRVKLLQSIFTQSADLQVGAPRQVHVAVAQARGDVDETARLRETERTAPRPHARDHPVAARHRPQRTGAPALHLEGGRQAHVATPTELRRVVQSPRARASSRRAMMAAAAAGLWARIADKTLSSAIRAACVASNRWSGTARAVAAKAKSASTLCAISATPRWPWLSIPAIQRGLVRRPRTTRAISSATRRARGASGWLVSG